MITYTDKNFFLSLSFFYFLNEVGNVFILPDVSGSSANGILKYAVQPEKRGSDFFVTNKPKIWNEMFPYQASFSK